MNCFERAEAINEELIGYRRYLHRNAEVGLHTPNTKAFVMEKLREMGIKPRDCGEGVSAEIGSGGKLFLLRADMDALPLKEKSGLDFACTTGQAHCCGHDLHTAMLLGAAKLLHEDEAALQGRVRLMFQSGEEVFEGGKNMIEHGILDPAPDAALAYHVGVGHMPIGMYMYNDRDTMMFSMDGFDITFEGKGSHGAYPHSGIDPINMAVHAYLAFQELIARESDPNHACVLTVGKFDAGVAPNIIPDIARIEGSLRTDNAEARELLVRRIKEVAEGIAKTYGGEAEVIMKGGVPPLLCDPDLTREISAYMQELPIPNLTPQEGIRSSASEDFAFITERVPGTFMYLSAGFDDQRGNYPAHSPRVQFNEEVLPIGAACMAHCARRWLEEHR